MNNLYCADEFNKLGLKRGTPEFRAWIRKKRGLGPVVSKPYRKRKPKGTPRGKYVMTGKPRRPSVYTKKPGRPRTVAIDSPEHTLRLDKRTGFWRVPVPLPSGRNHWISTGQSELKLAIKMIDDTGIQRLSMLARARVLTSQAINLVTGSKTATVEAAIDKWADQARFYSAPKTIRTYHSFLRQLASKLDCMKQPPSFLTQGHLHDFVNEPGIRYNARIGRLAAIRSFYRFASAHGHVVGNLSGLVKIDQRMVTVEDRIAKPAVPMTEKEYRQILMWPLLPNFHRWATVIGYWLGLRLVDVCCLEWKSIEGDFVVIYPKKTGRKLILPMHDPLLGSGELKVVFDEMMMQPDRDPIYCFPKQRARRITNYGDSLSHEYTQEIRKCSVYDRTFHSLRHAFRLRLSAAGKTIEEVAGLMGHADTKITEGYGRASTAQTSPPPSAGAVDSGPSESVA